jgi:hypothetical protein
VIGGVESFSSGAQWTSSFWFFLSRRAPF